MTISTIKRVSKIDTLGKIRNIFMLKKIVLVAAATLPLLMVSQAQAEITGKSGRTMEQVYKECGLGGLLLGKSSPILAVISNVTWDLGTTAAISDSVSPETCLNGNTKAAVLIKEAFPSVEKDLAAGSGAHLNALNGLMSCEAASAGVRQDYADYTQTVNYQSATQDQNAAVLFNIVNQNMAAAGCNFS